MRIALVDSGVDCNSKVIKEVRTYQGRSEKDEFGHGTMCFNIINRTCNKSVEIMAVNVLDKQGQTKLKIIEEALHDLLDDNVELICMSLAAIDCQENNIILRRISKLCRKLLERGSCIVSSHANGQHANSFPADFQYVLGVRRVLFQSVNEYWFNIDRMEAIADRTPVLVRNHRNERKFFFGNSKANAEMSRIILDQCIKEKDIYRNLLKNAKKQIWNFADLKRSMQVSIYTNLKQSNLKYYHDLVDLCQQYPCYADESFQTSNSSMDLSFYLRLDMCDRLINAIEDCYGKTVEDDRIHIEDFLNIYQLSNAVENRWFEN